MPSVIQQLINEYNSDCNAKWQLDTLIGCITGGTQVLQTYIQVEGQSQLQSNKLKGKQVLMVIRQIEVLRKLDSPYNPNQYIFNNITGTIQFVNGTELDNHIGQDFFIIYK